jgi:hypothetical protein
MNIKDKKQTTQNQYHDTVKSLNGWMRKLEQTQFSLSSRITAIENRLSIDSNNYEIQETTDSLQVKKQMKTNNLSNSSINQINDEIRQMKNEIDALSDIQENQENELNNISQVSHSNPVLIRLKGKEIPLEVSGIIGGILAILISIMIFFDGKNIITSPIFLGTIGVILITSSIIRSINFSNYLKNISKKHIDINK